MINADNISKLKCIVMPGQGPQERFVDYYEKTYAFWHRLWRETFCELTGDKNLFSDEFLRQKEVSAIFDDDVVVGVFLFKWLNLNCRAHREHSYFKHYPSSVINVLLEAGHRNVMTMGNLAVDPRWRRTQSGLPVSEILLGLATKRFLESDATALISYTRNDRKVNELVYRHGAVPLSKMHKAHNVEVDLTAIYRNSVKTSPISGVSGVVEWLWNSRIDFLKSRRQMRGLMGKAIAINI